MQNKAQTPHRQWLWPRVGQVSHAVMLLYQDAASIETRVGDVCTRQAFRFVTPYIYCLHFKPGGVLLRPLTHFTQRHCDLHIVALSSEMPRCYGVEFLVQNKARHIVMNTSAAELILSSCSRGPEPLKTREPTIADGLFACRYQVGHTRHSVNRLRQGRHRLWSSYSALKQH